MRLSVLFFATLFFCWPVIALSEHDTLNSYRCASGEVDRFGNDISDAELFDGQCLPSRTTHFDQDGRVAMYIRCRAVKGGGDEYTGNCCDHLRDADSYQFKVCKGATEPQSGLGLMLQVYKIIGPTRWVCEEVDCQKIGRMMGVPWL